MSHDIILQLQPCKSIGRLPQTHTKLPKRRLEPMERITEILFGLVMVLAVTCSFSVREADQKQVAGMLAAALGCNLAWGLIDAVFYCMGRFSEQSRGILALQALRATSNSVQAGQIIADALPPLLGEALTPAEFKSMHYRLRQLPQPPAHPRFTKDDWLAALGVFLLVFLSTFPVVTPFLFVRDAHIAIRASNVIAILMLFLTGFAFGKHTGYSGSLAGIAMVLVGGALVGITIALGG